MSGRSAARTVILILLALPVFSCSRRSEPPVPIETPPLVPEVAATPPADVLLGSGQGPAEFRMSYITHVNSDGCWPDGCEWRLYDPGTGEDVLYMRLQGPPGILFWDRDLSHVYFRRKSTVYSAEWRQGSSPKTVLELPPSQGDPEDGWLSRSNPWLSSETGRWRYWELFTPRKKETDVEDQDQLKIYEQSGSAWSLIADLKTTCECCGCPCTSRAKPYEKTDRAPLPDFGEHPTVQVETVGAEVDEVVTAYVTTPSLPRRALKMRMTQSEEERDFLPPVVWVDRDAGTESVIYDDTDTDCKGDFSFSAAGPYILITRYGDCPKVVDMRTGRILFAPARANQADQPMWTGPFEASGRGRGVGGA